MVERLRTYNYYAFLIISIFIFFDGIRSNLIVGGYITIIREFAVFYLFVISFYTTRKRQFPLNKSIIFFFIYHSIISFISIFLDGYLSLSFIVKPFELLGLIYCFYNYEYLTNENRIEYVKRLIYIAVWFCVINSFFYFLNLNIWVRPVLWWGRISCGYPTMDVISLTYALVLLSYYPNLPFSNKRKIIFLLILMLGVILNFSGTGMVILFVLLAVFFITSKLFKNNNSPLIASLLLLLLMSSSVTFLKVTFPNEFDSGVYLLQNKWNSITGDAKGEEDNTLEMRDEQYDAVKKRLNGFTQITGIGLNHMTMDRDWDILRYDPQAYSIENQYKMLIMGYGYIGLILYIFIFIELAWITLYSKFLLLSYKIMYLLCLFIAFCNSYTLISLMMFSNFSFFAFVISDLMKMRRVNRIKFCYKYNTKTDV